MLLFVGLGNPGTQYARNRHNVGFMAIDAIVAAHGFGAFRNKFQGLASDGRLAGEKVLAFEPLTFMNNSGQAVAAALSFYKLTPADLIVFYDEIDLAPGKVRVKRGGGTAGHNGVRSLDRHVGPDFRRVRIGVGHPGHKDRVHGHVLHDFSKADETWLNPTIDAIAREAPLLAAGDDAAFMSRVAMAINPPDKKDRANDAERDRG